ncbi:hypothetical protein RQP46_002152 [Phenoliferia psychrophenolica]
MENLHLQAVEQRAEDAEAHRKQIENFIDVTCHELRNHILNVSRLNIGLLTINEASFNFVNKVEEIYRMFETVEDTGKGLTETEMKSLFERFAQANPRTDQYGGSGLGLYVSKRFVELHHGFIEVDSKPGEGSTFRFAVPCERGTPIQPSKRPSLSGRGSSTNNGTWTKNKTPRSDPDLLSVPDSRTASPIEPEPAVPLHILVVEDNVINQKVLKRQLLTQKYTVTLANNGQEALDAVQAVEDSPHDHPKIDGILLDIEMPVMGGLECIRELRSREASQRIKGRYGVVAVTGSARKEQVEEYLRAGFDDVAVKPYSFSRLIVQIEQLTSRVPSVADV